LWLEADEEEEDDEERESLYEEICIEQSDFFRKYFHLLPELDRDMILFYCNKNDDFEDQFRDYYGHIDYDRDFA